MDRSELKSVILKSKSKGVQYMVSHFELIHELINEGETANAIYDALLASDSPPPISKSQFYRHLNKYKETADSETSNVISTRLPSANSESKHDVLDEL